MIDPISSRGQRYEGLEMVYIEKCWSITDDSAIREFIHKSMMSDLTRSSINHIKVWDRLVLNSPRYKKREDFELFIGEQQLYNVTTNEGYFIGSSNMPTNAVTITTSHATGLRHAENYFWSTETSLCDFEQYCIRQRRSLLFG